MDKNGGDVFALGEDRPTLARLLLGLDPDIVRVFSLRERRAVLDLLEKTYPEHLSPSAIAKRTSSDNKSVSNTLNYLMRSSGMIDCKLHEYRLSQDLMRPVEGRFEKVRFGLGLAVFFALAAGLLVVSGFSSPLLALAYLGLCFSALYSYSKRQPSILFVLLVGLMVMGETGYVLWHARESNMLEMWMDGTNQTRAVLLRASSTAGTLDVLGTTIEPEDLATLSTKLDADLIQAAALLSLLGSTESEVTVVMEGIAENLRRLAASSLSSLLLDTGEDLLVGRMLAHISDLLGRSVKTGRTWLGTRKMSVDVRT